MIGWAVIKASSMLKAVECLIQCKLPTLPPGASITYTRGKTKPLFIASSQSNRLHLSVGRNVLSSKGTLIPNAVTTLLMDIKNGGRTACTPV